MTALPRGRGKLSDGVVAAIQADILGGKYAPGDRLPTEAELCEQLGVSRSVVRDALRSLSGLGLVTVRHGYGIEVAAPTGDAITMATVLLLARSGVSMGDLVEARAFLEISLASEAAVRGTAADWGAMRGSLDGMRAAVAGRDAASAERLHREFHLGLLDAVHLPALAIVLRPVQGVIAVSSSPHDPSDLDHWDVESHVPILEALERGDADAARDAMTAHFAFAHDGSYEAFLAAPFRHGFTNSRRSNEARHSGPSSATANVSDRT
jgi:DNA-binding FadR family transcriptional regulator